MFPIGDDQVKGGHTPYFTRILIAINIGVFLYQMTLGEAATEAFFQSYATLPALIMQGDHLYSLVTSMFLHGSIMHIVGNMLFLWIFGDNIEARMGNMKFLIFYLVCGVIASLAHVLTDVSSMIPSLGASGAISGVLGAYLVLFPGSRIKILSLSGHVGLVGASQFLIYWIVLQLISGFGSLAGGAAGGVAWFAHIGGFAAGRIWGMLNRKAYKESVEQYVEEQNRFMR